MRENNENIFSNQKRGSTANTALQKNGIVDFLSKKRFLTLKGTIISLRSTSKNAPDHLVAQT